MQSTRRREHAASRGIILADTKLEFGIRRREADEILLIDEVLTPDSSRFWPRDQYAPGGLTPASTSSTCATTRAIGWNKQPPVPSLPGEVVARTPEKYRDAYRHLTGQDLA